MEDSAQSPSLAAAPVAVTSNDESQHNVEGDMQTSASSDSAAIDAASGGGGGVNRAGSWGIAKTVLHGVRAANKFQTLRDLIGTDAYIEESRLKMLKALGEGAFAKVQQAELLPASDVASDSAADAMAAGSAQGLSRQSVDLRPRMCAVKILRKELLEDPEQVQMFVAEVALLRRLRHRHIVRFIGCSWHRGDADGSTGKGASPQEMYYVQEYCAGGSLGDLLRKQMVQPFKKLYSDSDALRWSLHIAKALKYLHEARPVVIHRDLKLENVMLTHSPSSTQVARAEAKLGDFGLARLTPPAEKEKIERLTRMLTQPKEEWDPTMRNSHKNFEKVLDRMLTSTTARSEFSMLSSPSRNSLLSSNMSWGEVSHRDMTGKTGSFGYMAPEVSRNQQYNAQADIFSLGMCMYNLFNRTIPTVQILLNGDESHLELYAAKVADGYRPPMLATVPPSVKGVIEACWKGSGELRPTAREVVEMLEKIEESGEIPEPAANNKASAGCGCTLM